MTPRLPSTACRLLLLALLLALPGCGPSSPASRTPPPGTISIDPASPRGEVSWPVTFQWKTNGPSNALRRVTIYDAAERQLLEQDTKADSMPAPRDLEKFLATSRQFLWRVSLLDDNGAPIAQSPLTEFSVGRR